jgi:hypothetical protein
MSRDTGRYGIRRWKEKGKMIKERTHSFWHGALRVLLAVLMVVLLVPASQIVLPQNQAFAAGNPPGSISGTFYVDAIQANQDLFACHFDADGYGTVWSGIMHCGDTPDQAAPPNGSSCRLAVPWSSNNVAGSSASYAISMYNCMDGYPYDVGNYQHIAGTFSFSIPWSFSYTAQLHKSSANPSITDGNPLYSLAGATYGIYDGSGTQVATFTCDANGDSNVVTVNSGTYTVKETSAPQGYALDPTTYTISDSSPVLYVQDPPLNDPPGMLVQKLDTVTGQAYGQDDTGGTLLAGAEFTVKYYTGYYNTPEEAAASGAPTRTWVFVTENDGIAYFNSDDLKAGSDALYSPSSGVYTIPLGTVTVQETTPPPGYMLQTPNTISVVQTVDDGSGNAEEVMVTSDGQGGFTRVQRLNAIQIPETPHQIVVTKQDQDSSNPLQGATFTIYKSEKSTVSNGVVTPYTGNDDVWDSVDSHVTGQAGQCTFTPVTVGYYKVVETAPAPGYNGADTEGLAPQYVTVNQDTDSVTANFGDWPLQSLTVHKSDADNGTDIAGTQYTLYQSSTSTVSNGTVTPVDGGWTQVGATKTTGQDGSTVFTNLPFGYYKVVETQPATGYQSPAQEGNDPTQYITIDANDNYIYSETVDFSDWHLENLTVNKLDQDTSAPVQGEQYSLYQYSPITVSNGIVTTDTSGITENDSNWQYVATQVTGQDGSTVFTNLPFGYYKVVEAAPAPGYQSCAQEGQADYQFITIDASDNTPDCDFAVQNSLLFQDWQLENLTVQKSDKDTSENVPGTTYDLYQYSPITVSNGIVTTDTSGITENDSNWQYVATQVTGQDGSTVFTDLPFGYYKVVEAAPAPGYQSRAQEGQADYQFITIDASDNTPDCDFAVQNSLLFQDWHLDHVVVDKQDLDTGAGVGGTSFALYVYSPIDITNGAVSSDVSNIGPDDAGWTPVSDAYVYDAAGNVVDKADDPTGTPLTDTGVTTDDGHITFNDLPFGYYKLVETLNNPLYATAQESNIAPRMFKVEAPATGTVEVFKDNLAQVSCQVHDHTIAVTDSAFDGTPYGFNDNTGNEEYLYNFAARSTSNISGDEFVVTNDLTDITDNGYRVTTLWTGTTPAGLDYDGKCAVLYKTNMTTSADTPAYTASPTVDGYNNPNDDNDYAQWANEGGWKLWQQDVGVTQEQQLNVSDLNLRPGEYITGIRIDYGGVTPGFFTGAYYQDMDNPGYDDYVSAMQTNSYMNVGDSAYYTPVTWDHSFQAHDWTFAVDGTHAINLYNANDVQNYIHNNATSDIMANAGVLLDHDIDAVQTTFVSSFALPTNTFTPFTYMENALCVLGLPQTSDSAACAYLILLLMLIAGVMLIIISRCRYVYDLPADMRLRDGQGRFVSTKDMSKREMRKLMKRNGLVRKRGLFRHKE